MGKKQIYLVYDCDDWKGKDSMRLALATTSQRRLKSFIAHKIEQGDFAYSGVGNTPKQLAETFKKDFDKMPRDWIDSRIRYGFFTYVYDGEEI